jgi:hypothetical protein
MRYKLEEGNNLFQIVVSPQGAENVMWINQDAYFSLGTFDGGKTANYNIQHPGNGAYVFIIDGQAELAETILNKRDAMGIYETETLEFKFSEDSWVLVIEVPMQ